MKLSFLCNTLNTNMECATCCTSRHHRNATTVARNLFLNKFKIRQKVAGEEIDLRRRWIAGCRLLLKGLLYIYLKTSKNVEYLYPESWNKVISLKLTCDQMPESSLARDRGFVSCSWMLSSSICVSFSAIMFAGPETCKRTSVMKLLQKHWRNNRWLDLIN